MSELGTYYVVRWYTDDLLAYVGRSLVKATIALMPGTCYGKGETLAIAEHACRVQCAAARESMKHR